MFYEGPIKANKLKIRICAVRLDRIRGFFKSQILYDKIILDGTKRGSKLSNIEEKFLSR